LSRTIRRKNGYNLETHGSWKTGLWDCVWFDSKYGGRFLEYVRYEGKELTKRIAFYHSDCYRDDRYCEIYPHHSRQTQHKIHRARVRHELARYIKDNDYEVMVRKNPHLNYWH
jgi:hypothetical protein